MEELAQVAKHYFGEYYEEYKQEADRKNMSVEELYIRETKRNESIRNCNECHAILPGFFFCCSECEFYDGYNLCVKCYYDGEFTHQHDSFADNHSILTMVKKGSRKPTCVIKKTTEVRKGFQVQAQQTKELDKGKGKQDLPIVAKQNYTRPPAETKILEGPTRTMIDKQGIEKLERIANAHYNAASKKIKIAATAFCESLFPQTGNNDNKSLTQNEFKAVMQMKGYPKYADEDLFRMLAKDGHHVTMSEARTLYYILLSGRPFCSACEQFIPDIFFCCSECPAAKYALCLDCYEAGKYGLHKQNKHKHLREDDDVFFLDYTVLHTGCTSAAPTPNLQTDYLQTKPEPSSNEIVKKDKRTEFVTTFSAVLTTCTAALNFATAFCTIM